MGQMQIALLIAASCALAKITKRTQGLPPVVRKITKRTHGRPPARKIAKRTQGLLSPVRKLPNEPTARSTSKDRSTEISEIGLGAALKQTNRFGRYRWCRSAAWL
jgi:hypothetical protein